MKYNLVYLIYIAIVMIEHVDTSPAVVLVVDDNDALLPSKSSI